jgi:hypothetical protein
MASGGKRKTTMAKLNRERRLLERRQEKQARKDARRASANDPGPPPGTLTSSDGESALLEQESPALLAGDDVRVFRTE